MTIIISETPDTPHNILKRLERRNTKRDLAYAVRSVRNILLNFPDISAEEKVERIQKIIDLSMV